MELAYVTGEQPAVLPVGDEGLVVVGETLVLDVVSEGQEPGAEGQLGVPGQAGVEDLRGAVLVSKPPRGVGGEDSDSFTGLDESKGGQCGQQSQVRHCSVSTLVAPVRLKFSSPVNMGQSTSGHWTIMKKYFLSDFY